MTTPVTTYAEADARAKVSRLAASTEAKIATRDAEVERKIRAKEAETELALKRAEAALAERQAKAAAKDAEAARKSQRRTQRRQARAERRAEATAAALGYVRGNAPAVYSAGIYAMALYVAVSGQVSVAVERGWPIAIGIGMAAFLEGTALSMALTAHQQRLKGERALTPRVMTWVAASFAAAINFGAHADDLVMAAVLGASSLAAIVVWEVRSGAKHRDALRKLGLIPEPPERFGWRRWLRYPRSTFAAWSLDVRSRVGTGAAALLARVEADRQARTEALAAERREAEAARTAGREAKAAEKAARRDAAKLARSEAKAAKQTVKTESADRSDAEVPAKPRRKARTGTGKAKRTGRAHAVSDAALVDRLRAIADQTGQPVSLNRARTELGVGTGRAKRLLDLAAQPA
ncbi:DUF2637 domain-containing protein, partial [Glycomyces tarimensis]